MKRIFSLKTIFSRFLDVLQYTLVIVLFGCLSGQLFSQIAISEKIVVDSINVQGITLINGIEFDTHNNVLFATERGVFKINRDKIESNSVDKSDYIQLLKDEKIQRFCLDRLNNLWIINYEGELLRIENKDSNMNERAEKIFFSPKEEVTYLLNDQSRIVFGTSQGNVFEHDLHDSGYRSLFSLPEGIKCIFSSIGILETLWIGTEAGLYRCQLKETRGQKISAGFLGGGENYKITRVKKDEQINGITAYDKSIFTISLTSSGPKLSQYNILNEKWADISLNQIPALYNHSFNDITFDRRSYKLLIATAGLAIYDLKTNKWELYNKRNSGIKTNYAITVNTDYRRNVWLGTEGKGIYKCDINPVRQNPNISNSSPEIRTKKINCSSLVKSGGYEVAKFKMDMGVDSGVLRLRYNMFKIPDSLIIYSDGKVIYRTEDAAGNFAGVSGVEEVEVSFFSREIEIVVKGGKEKTNWNFDIQCPR